MKGYIKLEYTPAEDGGTRVTGEIDLDAVDNAGSIVLLKSFLDATEISVSEARKLLRAIAKFKKKEAKSK